MEVRTGLLFAISGMIGAPIGSYLSTLVPENVLLFLFAVLMLIVAQRMWAKTQDPHLPTGVCSPETLVDRDRSACQRDDDGKLRLNSRCVRLLIAIGWVTGVLSGMFGVGGGFVIVPGLVLFSGMAIHQAVATSLLVIVLISSSGVASRLIGGNHLSVETTLQFLVGGGVGMGLGSVASKRLNGPTLQKTFSLAVVMVAAFVIFKSVVL